MEDGQTQIDVRLENDTVWHISYSISDEIIRRLMNDKSHKEKRR